jgi:hypothetical protein
MKNTGYGWPSFVSHEQLYPPSKFVKNDVIYLCAEISREASQSKTESDFHQNLSDSYKQGLYESCILNVKGHEFKVEIIYFKQFKYFLGFEDIAFGSIRRFQRLVVVEFED